MKLYRHSKSGKIYNVLNLAEHSETHEALVIYQQYPQDGINLSTVGARPTKLFMGDIILDGKVVPRFTELTEEELKGI